MSTIGKVFVVLNLLLAGLFLGYASTTLATADSFKKQYENEQAAHQATKTELEAQVAKLRTDLADARSRVDELTNERNSEKERADRADADLRDARAQIDTLTAGVQGIDARMSDLDQKLGDLEDAKDAAVQARHEAENERDAALDERDEAVAAKRDAEDQARQLGEKIAGLEEQLFQANQQIAQLDTGLKMLQEQTGVSLAELGAAQPDIDAAVLDVDYSLEPGLVALNVGSADQVKRGYVFDVWNGEVYKGQVKVMDVDEKVCSALVTRAVDGQSIRRGDSASTNL